MLALNLHRYSGTGKQCGPGDSRTLDVYVDVITFAGYYNIFMETALTKYNTNELYILVMYVSNSCSLQI